LWAAPHYGLHFLIGLNFGSDKFLAAASSLHIFLIAPCLYFHGAYGSVHLHLYSFLVAFNPGLVVLLGPNIICGLDATDNLFMVIKRLASPNFNDSIYFRSHTI
jgi:hypothetical protein